jgi:hypothetical protein
VGQHEEDERRGKHGKGTGVYPVYFIGLKE